MKKEKLKRWLAAGLVAAMTMTCLAGCGGGSSTDGDNGDSGEGGADGDGQVLKVAALESAYGADMWTEVAAAFEESDQTSCNEERGLSRCGTLCDWTRRSSYRDPDERKRTGMPGRSSGYDYSGRGCNS